MGAHHFCAFLWAQGLVSAFTGAAPRSVPPTLLTALEHWRDIHRGVTAQTLGNDRPLLLDLLTTRDERPEPREAKSLRAFILARAHRHGKGNAKHVVTATRMFGRFLIANGRGAPGVDEAMPTLAMWRLSTLPPSRPADDVERSITACAPAPPLGARDPALIWLMARLGLRGRDVVGLRFPELNWQEATLVVSGTSRRETRLSLPQDVGDALLHDLEDARPPVDIDRVFITVMAPWGPSARSVIRQTAARAIQRAGIRAPTAGSRVFRHSGATTMLRQGAALQTIGDLVRHTSLETSAHEAQVALDLLQHVARPWPEVALC